MSCSEYAVRIHSLGRQTDLVGAGYLIDIKSPVLRTCKLFLSLSPDSTLR